MSGHGEMLQQAAFDAIEDNGEPIKLVRIVYGEPDPVTGVAPETRTEQTVMAIVAKASGGVIQAFDNRFDSGTLIETHLRTVMVAGLGLQFEPMPGNLAEFDGVSWTVLGSTPERAEGLNVTFNLTVKR